MKTKRPDGYAKRPARYTKKELAAKYQVELRLFRVMMDPRLGRLRNLTTYILRLPKAKADLVLRFLYTEFLAWLRSGKAVHLISVNALDQINRQLPTNVELEELVNNGFGGDTGVKLAQYTHGHSVVLFR